MNCLIVDDEPIARRGLERMVKRHGRLSLVGSFGDPDEALEFAVSNDVGLVFLDVEMPGMNGIELARRLPERCMVIFTTAYSDYAVDSYEVVAIDYLVKPIDEDRFKKAIEKAWYYSSLLSREKEIAASEPEPDFIIVKSERRFVRIPCADIRYVEGLKDYVIIHLSGRRVVTRMTIKGIEAMLPSGNFIRIGKSYIVNQKHVDSFDTNDVYIGTVQLSIGASYRDRILSRLLSH